MLEWYRANEPLRGADGGLRGADLPDAAEGRRRPRCCAVKDRTADPFAAPERLTVAEAFRRIRRHRPAGDAARRRARPRPARRRPRRAHGIQLADDDTWSDLFSRVLVERIEPQLGIGRPTFLTEYPMPEGGARAAEPTDPRVAQRFELYACGVELANGFGELTDPVEQRRRFEHAMAEKQRIYGERYPIDRGFPRGARPGMPPATGIALGFDRLVMLATGAARIEQVLWAPVAGPAIPSSH